ncbi:isocitrate lyase/phosphoenolpyruvate mutase family protein [Microbacterium hominis]|uniref:isocitrate lyase/phosphoenolpyruvate mutase family protein n=1 Tax=Microbacterium hominis TaxID=162426 RepID=UPI0007688E06|nr:isocitrate lyase/phosphoenolpyruvate mutase family protein [Microbacterium hominis]KXC05665.1 phosphonomutase [Microbacterium hominis]
MTDDTTAARAQRLRDLYTAPEILRVVNVWDVVSAQAVLALPETRALATAGHSIAASFGYADGTIPLETTLDMVGRIVSVAGEVPVSADLDDGYDEPGETVRRAIGVGIVGANMEDRLRPFDASVARVAAAVAAAAAEGVPFALNARTDAIVRGGERPPAEWMPARSPAVARSSRRARSALGPGVLDADATAQLVAGIGERAVGVIGLPGALAAADYEKLGVARISYGPLTQRVALTAFQDVAAQLYADGVIPEGTRALN